MRINVIVSESVCLSAYVKQFYVYLLFNMRCNIRRSIVIVSISNEPSCLGVKSF